MAASMVAHTVGVQHILGILNASQTKTTNVYLLLRQLDGAAGRPADAVIADTLTTNLSEVSATGTGYGRIAMAWTTGVLALVSGDAVITFPAQVFSFTGALTATHAAIATTVDNTGVLIGSVPLQVVRNFANGDTDTVTFKLQLGQHV